MRDRPEPLIGVSGRGGASAGLGRLLASLAAACAVAWLADSAVRTAAAPVSTASASASTAAPFDTRALWVLRGTLTTPERIDELVHHAAASGFNTLLLQVRARGDAFFAGSVEPRGEGVAPGFDPLAHALASAHAAGLRVHIWINVNLVASAAALPTDASHLVYTHPDWLMVPRDLAPALAGLRPRDRRYLARLAEWTRARPQTVEGLYASPVPVESARYLEKIVADLATRYAVDGVHLDYVRYPGSQFDYSPAALDAFRRSLLPDLAARDRARLDARLARAPLAYADAYPARWAQYRRTRLTDLVARLRGAVKIRRPRAWISAAVVPDAAQASRDRLQDWPDWARRGLLDAICPMAYTADLPQFTRQIGEANLAAGGQPVWAGVGAYRMSPAQTVRHIAAARAAGARGVVLFSYDSLVSGSEGRDALGEIGRGAFGDAGTPIAASSK